MLNFVSKRLIICNGNHAFRSILSRGSDFLQNSPSLLLPRFNFISTDVNQDSFAVSYLVTKLGFSHETAIASSKNLNLKTPDKADSVLTLFEKHGITKPQVKQFVERDPRVLQYDPAKTLLPKIQFFESKGISGIDLGAILTSYPTPFSSSLKNHIIPCFNYLSNLLESEEEAVSALKLHPMILSHNVVKTMVEPFVNVLLDNGVSVPNIVLFLKHLPDFKSTKLDKFKEDIEMVKGMGVSPLRSQFMVAIVGKRAMMNKKEWQKKVAVYKKWGFSEEQIVGSFVRLPWFMVAPDDKINMAMEFFVNELGWGPSVIANRPVLISLSLKKRLIPRAAVFKYLTSRGLVKDKDSNITKYMECTEKDFVQRYVIPYEEAAPDLLKLYKQKLKFS